MSNEKPLYLIAGKGSSRTVLARFFHMAFEENGLARPHVAYIGTASGDDKPFFRMLETPILQAGAAEAVLVPLAKRHPDLENAQRIIARSEVVFLNGGEVYDGMEGLKHAGLIDFLTAQFHVGKLFIGLSAGAIMLGKHWVLMPGEQGCVEPEVFDCLGFAPANFDTHAEKEDWIELKTLLGCLGPDAEGCGIATGGFLKVDARGNCTNLTKKSNLFFRNTDGNIHEVRNHG